MLNKTIASTCVLAVLTSATMFGTLQENRDKSLLGAVKSNDRVLVSSLIELKTNVDTRDADSLTPLHWAAHNGYAETIGLLITAGASLAVRDTNGFTPLHKALAAGRSGVVGRLTNGTMVTIADNKGETALHKAVLNCTTAVVPQALIDAGANVNAQDENGWTPLHLAAFEGKLAIVQCLLRAGGIQVDAQTTKGCRDMHRSRSQLTALHIAAEKGFAEIAQALLAAGARSNARNNFNETPLMLAAEHGHVAIVEHLVNIYRVNLEDRDNAGYTAFNNAMWAGHVEVGRILIKAGAETGARSGAGLTPLHNAAWNGRFKAVELLIQERVYLNVQSNSGRTPLCFAGPRIADLLRRNGALDKACECSNCKGCIIA